MRAGEAETGNAGATAEARWFVSTDGPRIQTPQTTYHLMINGFTKASDGMELPRYESFSTLALCSFGQQGCKRNHGGCLLHGVEGGLVSICGVIG